LQRDRRDLFTNDNTGRRCNKTGDWRYLESDEAHGDLSNYAVWEAIGRKHQLALEREGGRVNVLFVCFSFSFGRRSRG
jgi:hypothetical protein